MTKGTTLRPTVSLMVVVVTLFLATTVGNGAQIPKTPGDSNSDGGEGGRGSGGRRLHYRMPSSPLPDRVPSDEIELQGPYHKPPKTTTAVVPPEQEVRIECNSDEIAVAIRPAEGRKFDGMVYPKGLSKNSSCLAEFMSQTPPVRYILPLRSCNTMSTDLSDGGVEYFNTIVVQPHRKLVTNQGRGYHIRCRYQTKDKTILSHFNVSMMGTTPIAATAPMPGCSMKIYAGDPALKKVAENVRIGDPLALVISIEDDEEEESKNEKDNETTEFVGNLDDETSSIPAYGIWVTECLVRDGLGWGEQNLIDSDGCPLDGEIMGQFEYNAAKTTAAVRFQAHKFPYTASVYYQCNVRLCVKAGGGCDDTPSDCGAKRKRREAVPQVEGPGGSNSETGTKDDGSSPATIEVYSGLYVNEGTDAGVGNLDPSASDTGVAKEKTPDDPDSICISKHSFAIGIAIAGLLLMLAVLAAVLIIVSRRRRRGRRRGKAGESTIGGSGSSIYSGPYTNTAYSHSS